MWKARLGFNELINAHTLDPHLAARGLWISYVSEGSELGPAPRLIYIKEWVLGCVGIKFEALCVKGGIVKTFFVDKIQEISTVAPPKEEPIPR